MPDQIDETEREMIEDEKERREEEATREDYASTRDIGEGLPRDLEFMFDITKFENAKKSIGLGKEISTSNFQNDIDEQKERIKYKKFMCALNDFPDEPGLQFSCFGDFYNFLLSKCSFKGWARELSRSSKGEITRRIIKEEGTKKAQGI